MKRSYCRQNKGCSSTAWVIVVGLLTLGATLVSAFGPRQTLNNKHNLGITTTAQRRRLLLRLHESSSSQEAAVPSLESLDLEDASVFVDATLVDVILSPHRPLGCTIEECLPDGNHVFVSKVTPGSFGDQGGLQVGDVILACSDIFGSDLASVTGPGMMDSLLGLVQARPDHESLHLRVARGSTVHQQHEAALVELCSNPDASMSEVEDCLMDYWRNGYVLTDDNDEEAEEECTDEENCPVLDSAFDLWNEDFNIYPKPAVVVDDRPQPATRKVKPWSSRSSPSGTFVRDPVTGEMRNIDA